jgi:hypothetical protein
MKKIKLLIIEENRMLKNLFVSTFTVKSHIHNIMEKLVLHTRLELANYSYSTGAMKKIVKNISFAN